MRRLLTTLVILTGLFCSAGAVWAQDYEEGLKAYRSNDFATALKEWRPLAEQGNAIAQFNLGLLYKNGNGVDIDEELAAKWHCKAAEQGDEKFIKWCLDIAHRGSAETQYKLGKLFQRGQGVE